MCGEPQRLGSIRLESQHPRDEALGLQELARSLFSADDDAPRIFRVGTTKRVHGFLKTIDHGVSMQG
jgi:hypothetical protein